MQENIFWLSPKFINKIETGVLHDEAHKIIGRMLWSFIILLKNWN
jgi:hypothetical protein